MLTRKRFLTHGITFQEQLGATQRAQRQPKPQSAIGSQRKAAGFVHPFREAMESPGKHVRRSVEGIVVAKAYWLGTMGGDRRRVMFQAGDAPSQPND